MAASTPRRLIRPVDPYALIEEWWQEPLSAELVSKVGRTPERQLREFGEYLRAAPLGGDLPQLSNGHIRPLLLKSSIFSGKDSSDRHWHPGVQERYLRSILRLLLYCHEVMIEDPLSSSMSVGDEAESLVAAFEGLLAMQPLFRLGAVHYVSVKSAAIHPSLSLAYSEGVDWNTDEGAEATALLEPIFRSLGQESFEYAMFWYRVLIGSQLGVLAAYPRAAHLLAASPFEEALHKVAVGAGSRSLGESRAYRLRSLLSVPVPLLASDVKGLIALRSSDEFSLWRISLASALDDIQAIASTAETWEVDAREIISSEISPIRGRLDRAVKKSPALTAMKKGLRDITLSGVGALGGASAGGRLGPAIAGAAAGKTAEVFLAYVKAIHERRENKAILDLALRFDVDHRA